jgi:hypothetical protein
MPQVGAPIFRTILVTYVLNTIPPSEQCAVLNCVSDRIRIGGNVYVTVRRDIPREGTKTQRWVELDAPWKSIRKVSGYEIYRMAY